MAAERIIGVDFGTSTSVIRVKRYQDGKPVGDRLETKPVTFNMGSTMVPTLIQKLPSGDAYYGYDAESSRRKTETFQNFKADIENPDEDIQRQARELTKEFFRYLAKEYSAQSEGGHLGAIDDRPRTIISYPVKWSDKTKTFMIQTAKNAGFPHVEGIDEAQAAIQAVTVQNADLLTRKGYFRDGVPINILLIDMGAGTTDLVLCCHTPGEHPMTKPLVTWPKGENVLFGGREVDELLKDYLCRAIPEDDINRIGIGHFREWKESTVAPALGRGETVDFFSILSLLDVNAEFSISRESFEMYAADYLRQFPELVNGCLEASGIDGDDVDLVILTGGHSQWYFVREMLSGKLGQFGEISLGKIQADSERIIPITLPQETVALGLAYMPLKVEPPPPPPPDVFPLKYDPYSRIRPVIAAGIYHTVGLKHDGTVIAIGLKDKGQCLVNYWRDIVAIAAGSFHTMGLKRDGTVVAVGWNHAGQCNVSDWRDIVAIAPGGTYTVGLKKDGTVIAVGNNLWGKCNVSDWRDIVAIATEDDHTVGLKKDGTVVAAGWNYYGQCNVSGWRDIVAIAAGSFHTMGLKRDGTVVAVGRNDYGQCNVNNWRDIVAIAAGLGHTIGLKKDGTVVAVGDNDYGVCNVNSWRDIVAITAGEGRTVGLKKDGTLVAAGKNDYGACDVGEYKTIEGFFRNKRERQTPWKLF